MEAVPRTGLTLCLPQQLGAGNLVVTAPRCHRECTVQLREDTHKRHRGGYNRLFFLFFFKRLNLHLQFLEKKPKREEAGRSALSFVPYLRTLQPQLPVKHRGHCAAERRLFPCTWLNLKSSSSFCSAPGLHFFEEVSLFPPPKYPSKQHNTYSHMYTHPNNNKIQPECKTS